MQRVDGLEFEVFGGRLGFESGFKVVGDDRIIVLELADKLMDTFMRNLAN